MGYSHEHSFSHCKLGFLRTCLHDCKGHSILPNNHGLALNKLDDSLEGLLGHLEDIGAHCLTVGLHLALILVTLVFKDDTNSPHLVLNCTLTELITKVFRLSELIFDNLIKVASDGVFKLNEFLITESFR